MQIKLRYVAVGFILVAAGHGLAIKAGLYQGQIWIDMPLHFASGILLGLLGIWLAQRFNASHGGFWAISVAMLGSFLWEIFEFFVLTYAANQAFFFKVYSLGISDLLSDLSLGLAGGVLTGIIYKIYK